jgi:hypothetical protein
MGAMKHEYHEGPKAGENFEKLARAVLQAPRVAVPRKQPKTKLRHRKTNGSDKGQNGSSCPAPAPGWWSEPASLPASWAWVR